MKTKITFLPIALTLFGWNISAQQLVQDTYPGSTCSFPSELINVNGTLFFQALTQAYGYELLKSDGTDAGTIMVKDIWTGTGSSGPTDLTVANNILYFFASDGVSGNEFWRSDGTLSGTFMVKDIRPTYSSDPYSLCNVNGTLFFSANDGTNGQELWKSDGTLAGTVMVKNIYSNSSNSNPEDLININGTLFFIADDGNGKELWKSDGTASGTVMVKDICNLTNRPMASKRFFTNINGILYFIPIDNSANTTGSELWKSDGTMSGTVLVKNIRIGEGGSNKYVTSCNSALYFRATDNVNGSELWKSDGTAAGTIMVKDINPGISNSYPYDPINFNNVLFFNANNGTDGYELWKSDGTSAGTVMVKDIFSGVGSSQPGLFLNFNNSLYFKASDGAGTNTWSTDGTAAGTIKHPNNNLNYGLTDYLGAPLSTVSNNTLFFRGYNSTYVQELWKYDGNVISVVEYKNNSEIDAYPNPNNGIFQIKNNNNAFQWSNLKIYNSQGQLVFESSKYVSEIDLSDQLKGIYFVQLKTSEGISTQKIIIQ